ncbi:MAG: hypothetical protein RSE01_06680 [Akkermansia sp.]
MNKFFCCIGAFFFLVSSASFGQWAAPASEKQIPLKKSANMLNVVYFLGNDTKPVSDYERRLSELLIYLQQFYGKEMARNGYGARSFGLDMKSKDRVNIIVYTAKNPAANYPYENGGGGRASNELDEFFKANPTKKKSKHTLVIMPTWVDDKNDNSNPGGVPFYGMGKICFALDYPDFDLKHIGQATKEGQLLTKWYGGLAHELGHGLNLPHNHATKSLQDKFGTALMGAGNYSFGKNPTFLTPASCALLNVCEVFSTSPSQKFYDGEKSVEVKNVVIMFKDNQILIGGLYKGNRLVTALNVYVQDPPYVVNRDYDAVSFSKKLGKKNGKFAVKIDRNELVELKDNDFRITLMFVLENGEKFEKHFEFKRDDLKDLREDKK